MYVQLFVNDILVFIKDKTKLKISTLSLECEEFAELSAALCLFHILTSHRIIFEIRTNSAV